MKKLKTYPALLRLWHWLTVLVITGVVGTAFLPGTFLNVGITGRQAREVLAGQQGQISEEQSWAIGRALAANAWLVHQYLGYGLVVLFVFRLVLEATGKIGTAIVSSEAQSSARGNSAAQTGGQADLPALLPGAGDSGGYGHLSLHGPLVPGIKRLSIEPDLTRNDDVFYFGLYYHPPGWGNPGRTTAAKQGDRVRNDQRRPGN